VSKAPTPRPLAPLYWGLLVSTTLAAAITAATFWLGGQAQVEDQWVRHTLAVRSELQRIQLLLSRAESSQRGFLLTGRDEYLAPFDPASDALTAALGRAAALIADNPQQVQATGILRQLVSEKLGELNQTIALRKNGHPDEALSVVNTGEGRRTMAAIANQIATMQETEDQLLSQREANGAFFNLLLQVGSIVVFLLIGAVAVLVAFFANRSVSAIDSSNAQLATANRTLLEQISQREQVEGQLRQAQKMEAIGQLTGGIAHDFNNMLGVVVGALDLMRRRLKVDEFGLGGLIDAAMKATERSAALTQRLLAFARQQPLAPEPLDANRMIAEMSGLLRSTLGEQIEIETVLAAGLWKTTVDPHQLESAIINISINARDAMPEGGKLTIETGNVYLDEAYCNENAEVAPGQFVLIAVSDQGVGMRPDVSARAFDPFFTTKPPGKGTGLGLSQVYGFVKQSRGHIKIYSELGTGTTVKIYLPRLYGQAEEPKRVVPQFTNGTANEAVLVVEDDPLMRRLSSDSLRELGYTVFESESAAGALAVLGDTPGITLLFTDVVMPEMNGKKLAEAALRIKPGLKVLFTTGYTPNAVVHGGVLDADVNFITKPFTLQQLANKVRAVLGA